MKKVALIIVLLFSGICQAKSKIDLEDSLTTFGDIAQYLVPIYAGLYSLDYEDYPGFTAFATSFAETTMITYFLKNKIPGRRPDGNKKGFPSGHTAATFSGATYLHLRYGAKVATIPYIAAGLTGISRIKNNKHSGVQVLGGAVIAGFFSWLNVSSPLARLNVAFIPDLEQKSFGINFHYYL